MEVWTLFTSQFTSTSTLEVLAVITGITSVFFSYKEKILVYPVGIISVLIYVYITWLYKLYADSAVHFYYFLMSVYGWYNWKHTPLGINQIPITKSDRIGRWLNGFIFLASFILLSFVLWEFTDSDVPFWDAFTTSAAITAMWLMARKKIEHWIFWGICNVISIPLYLYKGLPFTSFQFLIFGILSVFGWASWNKKFVIQQNER